MYLDWIKLIQLKEFFGLELSSIIKEPILPTVILVTTSLGLAFPTWK
jgi:hypothetical protein